MVFRKYDVILTISLELSLRVPTLVKINNGQVSAIRLEPYHRQLSHPLLWQHLPYQTWWLHHLLCPYHRHHLWSGQIDLDLVSHLRPAQVLHLPVRYTVAST